MVYDRTLDDVEKAIELREKVKRFEELTEDEIATMERGMLTLNVLNRIESKQFEVNDEINDIGYWNTNILNKQWTNTEVFNKSDFERILNNLNILKEAFFVYSSTPTTPKASYNYKNINGIEKILYDIEKMIAEVKSNFRECGTFYCGEG